MEEASSEELKKERKRTKKREKKEKVMNSSLEISANSVSAGTDDAVMAKKKKKRKKKREIEANGESVGGETPAEPEAEEESRSDKMRQQRETEVSNDSREGSAKPEAEESRNVKKKKKKKREIEVSNGSGELPLGKGSRKDEKKRKREIRGEEDTKGKETAKEDNKSKKRKNEKDATEGAEEDKVDEVGSSVGKGSEPKKRAAKSRKKISFSGKVEVFPPTNDNTEDNTVEFLVRGKRFTPEEDKLIKEAVFKYIEVNLLGEEGLQMVLNSRKHRQIRNCWKEIGASLPWRPLISVYRRAHILFERSENRKWEAEEYEVLRSFYKKHGADWKTLAKLLGKSRLHVKDTWRWLGMPNRKKGNWSQEEYQSLFDLVNMDLKMKVNEEKKTKYGMLKDNICWGAISEKLTTRFDGACCIKWYNQLSSPLVNKGLWVDSDDYRLVGALQKLDACCVADVDWDNLLEHRSGEICRKRWDQMVRHIGGNREKSFVEQVDVLSKRYPTEMIEYREE